MTEAARTAWRTSDSPAALSAATVHTHHFTSMSHEESRKVLRNIGHALITLAATLVAGAVSAQIGPVPPPPTLGGWTYSTIQGNVQVTGISQVLVSLPGPWRRPALAKKHIYLPVNQWLASFVSCEMRSVSRMTLRKNSKRTTL